MTQVATLMHTYIYSRVDYGNAIYADFTSSHIDQQQSVSNAATRLKQRHVQIWVYIQFHVGRTALVT